MDLEYGSDYEKFRKEVKQFIKENEKLNGGKKPDDAENTAELAEEE